MLVNCRRKKDRVLTLLLILIVEGSAATLIAAYTNKAYNNDLPKACSPMQVAYIIIIHIACILVVSPVST